MHSRRLRIRVVKTQRRIDVNAFGNELADHGNACWGCRHLYHKVFAGNSPMVASAAAKVLSEGHAALDELVPIRNRSDGVRMRASEQVSTDFLRLSPLWPQESGDQLIPVREVGRDLEARIAVHTVRGLIDLLVGGLRMSSIASFSYTEYAGTSLLPETARRTNHWEPDAHFDAPGACLRRRGGSAQHPALPDRNTKCGRTLAAKNQWLGGEPYWRGVQLGEAAYPVLLAALLAGRGPVAG